MTCFPAQKWYQVFGNHDIVIDGKSVTLLKLILFPHALLPGLAFDKR